MKILMFGWEFPPYKSGGLGTACYDLTKGLARQGVDVTFVMPVAPENAQAKFVKLIGANTKKVKMKIKGISTPLTPYMTSEIYAEEIQKLEKTSAKGGYGKDIFLEAKRYAKVAGKVAKEEDHDIIHVHDWMTYEAGIEAKKSSGKPIVAHIHATEFDRTAGNPNQYIADIEYKGMMAADYVIANSNFTKSNVIKCYGIPSEKIQVVHWGIEEDKPEYHINYASPLSTDDKIILFLGRITIQKGPDYFIEMAKKVIDREKKVKFVIAGDGDMMPRIIQRAAELGISDKVIFTGFLRGSDVHRAFQMADLYVMPSSAEPFGLVALEALKNKTPVLISNQSGVSEVLNHALKADFWDVDEMTNKIVTALKHPELLEDLKDYSYKEVQKFNLDEPARKTIEIYNQALKNR